MIDNDMSSSTPLESTPTRWPNLFLIGAPKCGTTAISHYLAKHPSVFMSEEAGMKEPQYFNSDHYLTPLYNPWEGRTEEQYLALFDAAKAGHKYVGEASVWYLYSDVAIREINNKCRDPRFIVMVRDPIQLAVSLYYEFLATGLENKRDFQSAWLAQERRLRGGEKIPAQWRDAKRLQYGVIAKLGWQLERLYCLVGRDRVHVIVYEDFRDNPRLSYLSVLGFLGLEDDGRLEFPVLNKRRRLRYPLIEVGLQNISHVRKRLGLPGGFGISKLIGRLNQAENKLSAPLDSSLRSQMTDYFRDDVDLLSNLIERDLGHYLDGSSMGSS